MTPSSKCAPNDSIILTVDDCGILFVMGKDQLLAVDGNFVCACDCVFPEWIRLCDVYLSSCSKALNMMKHIQQFSGVNSDEVQSNGELLSYSKISR